MLKGIKLRLYPSHQQRLKLQQMFGNNRFVWNQMLNMANERYKNNPNSLFIGAYGMDYLLKSLKQEYPFLKASDSSSLQVVNQQLNQSFQMLFKHRGGHPRFKSRHATLPAYTGKSKLTVAAKRYLKIPKLGYIKSSKTGQLNGVTIKQYTVKHEPTGRYYLSVQVEFEPQVLPKTGKSVGIDVGLSDLVITSDGHKYQKFQSCWNNKQARLWQRKFSKRKNQATVNVRQYNHNHKLSQMELNDYQNWQRAKQIKARYQCKVKQQRFDYLQKITTELVKKYDVICIEDLKAKNLQKNHKLAGSISNAAWRMFRDMLTYKCNWYGKQLVIVNPAYTTQICHSCGYCSGHKSLDIREWTCPKCHVYHDRDVNAAINILNKGIKKLLARN